MIYITAEACKPALLVLRKESLVCGEHSMCEDFTQEVTLDGGVLQVSKKGEDFKENKQPFSSREALRNQKLNSAKSREGKL